jgi:RHS repeat-associated protein
MVRDMPPSTAPLTPTATGRCRKHASAPSRSWRPCSSGSPGVEALTGVGVTAHGCDQKAVGRVVDPESGLLYLRNRYYDPSTGQFINRDPAVSDTQSAYGYVDDNPLNGTDPSGEFCVGTDYLGHVCTSSYDIIRTYTVHSTPPAGQGFVGQKIKLRFGDLSRGYFKTVSKHGGPYYGALKQTLENPDFVTPSAKPGNWTFERCFSNPFDSSEVATYVVVVSTTVVHGHVLGVLTAYWGTYYGWAAPWWAGAYAWQ